jgi:mannose-1-phosphate guanylyltransferase
MKALILAGGLGTRLYPLTWGRPKGLVPIGNRPFMERVFEWLHHYEISDAVLALSHFSDHIQDHLGDGSAWHIKLSYLLEDQPLGSGGAIKNAQQILGDKPFLVLNGDILTDLDLSKMILFHQQRKAKMTISLAQVDDPSHYGVVALDDRNRLLRFVEKPAPDQAPSRYINAGVWIFEPDMLDLMPPQGEPFSVERKFWPHCLEQDIPMYGYAEECYWLDIGTLERYKQANQDLLVGGIHMGVDGREIAPGIWISEGVEIHPSAHLAAPVIIGAHTTIGEGTAVTNSVIGTRCSIQSHAHIADSVLWDEVTIGSKAHIRNSIVGSRQVVSEAAVMTDKALSDSGARAPESV